MAGVERDMNDLDPPNELAGDDEIRLLDLLEIVMAHLRLLVLGPLLAGLGALGLSFLITPTFSAKTVFLPPQQQQSSAASLLASLGSLGGLAGAATGLKNPNDQYVAYLQSRRIAAALLQRFDLRRRYESEKADDAFKALSSRVRVTAGKNGLISVEADDHDPVFAAQLANAHVEELGRLLTQLAVTEAQQRRVFFERQLLDAKTKLTQADLALRQSGISVDVLKSSPAAAVGVVAELQAQVAAQEVKIASLRAYLAEAAPEMQAALTQLRALQAQLSKAARSETPSRPASDASYVARFRDFKYFETLVELFAKQFELAKIDEAREGAVIQVVDIAMPPDYKSKPKKALIATLTSLAAGMLLLLFVFFRHAWARARGDSATSAQLGRIRQHWRSTWSARTATDE